MDSLLANYASSDEEEERVNPPIQNQVKKKKDDVAEEIEDFLLKPTSKSIKFSLPPPKSSSSLLNSQPLKPQQLKQGSDDDNESKRFENCENSKPSSLFSSLPHPTSSSSLFSSLPAPKTQVTDPQTDLKTNPSPNTNPNPSLGTSVKRVAQFRPPVNPSLGKDSDDDEDEDEDEDEEEKEKRRRKAESLGQTASVKSFLSTIPAPKNSSTLGALPSSSGTGRRSIIETTSSVSGEVGGGVTGGGYDEGNQYVEGAPMSSNIGGSDSLSYAVGGSVGNGDYSNWGAGNVSYEGYDGYSGYGAPDHSNSGAATGDYPSYGSDYGSHANYGHYENNWSDESVKMAGPAPEVPFASELRLPTKRGRKDVPPQIVEVNQDELMKNRPREDQVKVTGIAFGPAYQPVSAKGKPSKLHKRKHQIGSLYFDMKQKETELAERRARGFLTKAQTQGKYGW